MTYTQSSLVLEPSPSIFKLIASNHIKGVQIVLSNTPELLETKTSEGKTPLIYASECKHIEIVKLLLKNGAKPNTKDSYNHHALWYSILTNNYEITHALLDAGANLNHVDNKNVSCFIYACASAERVSILELLIQRGAKIDHPVNSSALLIASHMNVLPAIKILLNKNISVLTKDSNGFDCIRAAVQKGHIDALQTLLEAKIDPNSKDKLGITSLMFASKNNNIEILNILLSHSADPNLKDINGNTALNHAVKEGHIDAVTILLKHGADSKIKNNVGQNALDIRYRTIYPNSNGKKPRWTFGIHDTIKSTLKKNLKMV
jgi:ankyrin repeat protein